MTELKMIVLNFHPKNLVRLSSCRDLVDTFWFLVVDLLLDFDLDPETIELIPSHNIYHFDSFFFCDGLTVFYYLNLNLAVKKIPSLFSPYNPIKFRDSKN